MICGPALGERAGHRGEHRERREPHHVIGELEHHRGRAIRRRGRSACAFSPTAVSATPKKIEKTTIGRISLLLIASKIDCGTTWLTKSLRLKAARLDAAGRRRRADRQVEADARLKQADEDQAEGQRDEARADEPAERPDADPAERGDVAHMGDARRPGSRRPAAR